MELPDSNMPKDDENTRDRISELSDDVLIKILSFLTSEEAVRTSFLSHRWQHLWEFLSVSFSFDGTKKEDCLEMCYRDNSIARIKILKTERREFVGWVNNVLILHQGSTIDGLSVRFALDKDSERYIDKWIDIALRKKVKKLELNFSTFRDRDSNMYYPFPQECFSRVKTTCGLSEIEFLTCLSLQSLGVSDEIMESILSNCPMLESLKVRCSPQLRDPKVSGSSLRLKHLHISYCRFVQSIEVCAPNLVSFEYSGNQIPLHVRYAPKLNEVYYSNPFDCDIPYAFSQLSNYLLQLVTLKLRVDLFLVENSHSFPKLTSLRHLSCEVLIYPRQSLFPLRYLIDAAPFLHKFTLDIFNSNKIQSNLGEVRKVEGHPNNYLKEVEMIGFLGQPVEAEFVTYLLKSAINLEKIVIVTRSSPNLVILECEKSKEFVETTRQMAENLIHQLMENRPGAELVLL